MAGGVLTIAGLDPSGGAGLLADIKVFERFQITGFAVATALTFQNEDAGLGLEWTAWDVIKKQLEPLFDSYEIQVAKIGIIENLTLLYKLVAYLKEKRKVDRIIWDPVIKASSGMVFLKELSKEPLIDVLKQVDVVTPNLDEADQLSEILGLKSAEEMSRYCNVVLKGGHGKEDVVVDTFYLTDETQQIATNRRLSGAGKRGTGCAFSAAMAASLHLGRSLEEAFQQANQYVFRLLQTTESKLGHHFAITT